jgi:hypothetical protein
MLVSFVLVLGTLLRPEISVATPLSCEPLLSASFKRSWDRPPADFHDLSNEEIAMIQNAVDTLGHEVFVVGSAAKGVRRNKGSQAPLGKGENSRSDIDYMLPTLTTEEEQRAREFLRNVDPAVFSLFPDMDKKHGFILSPPITTTLRLMFSPKRPPIYLERGSPNPRWAPYD